MANCYLNTFDTVANYVTATKNKPCISKITSTGCVIYDSTETSRCSVNDMELVDLGLPSGTLWAKCNFGASNETDFGFYYQWAGSIKYVDASTHVFNWESAPYHTGSDHLTNWSKYNTIESYGTKDDKTVLDNDDDPIYTNTNGKLKMPTSAQISELVNNTTSEWKENYNGTGVNGRLFKSKKNNNKLFFPAAGYCDGSSVYNVGSYVYVWSRSLNTSAPCDAYGLYCDASGAGLNRNYRYDGFSLRGVL